MYNFIFIFLNNFKKLVFIYFTWDTKQNQTKEAYRFACLPTSRRVWKGYNLKFKFIEVDLIFCCKKLKKWPKKFLEQKFNNNLKNLGKKFHQICSFKIFFLNYKQILSLIQIFSKKI